jgi:hypothetical protein
MSAIVGREAFRDEVSISKREMKTDCATFAIEADS